MSEKKKKVLIQTDFVLAKTGFGRNARAIFEYLYATNKYDLVNFAVGSVDIQVAQEADRTPWKTIASVNSKQLEGIKQQNDPKAWENIERLAGYGAFALDQAVKEEKPDVFFGVQDIWGIDFASDKDWFKKIPSVLWTTLDSLPILPKAVELAPKVKNYWCWADFATQALHKLGHTHVKTVRGAIDPKPFFRLPDSEKAKIRARFGIPEKTFVIGYVFRNQLRKSVPNLIQGYQQFKKSNPKILTRLLLHTCWGEGWDIPKLLAESGISREEVITTYVCRSCRGYQIKPFIDNDQNCPFCGREKAQCTTHPSIGVTEAQLNEVYNLMDVYCHPFTSGGQEIPIQEAKLTELITLVTNYSCGEDCCVPEAFSLPLDWSEYREPGTQFIKASTYPSDIAKQLTKVYNMRPETRQEWGKKARKWTLENFSIDVIGKILEDFIDSAPFAESTFFESKIEPMNPNFIVPFVEDIDIWIKSLYSGILHQTDKEGEKYWLSKIKEGVNRESIENYFRQVAIQTSQKENVSNFSFGNQLNPNDKGRVIIIQPKSAGDIFLVTSLFKSIKNRYPDWALYVATEQKFKEILAANPYVDGWIEYSPLMDNYAWLEGNSLHDGFFNIAYQPYLQTQRQIAHNHNGQDKFDWNINI